jgi:hypothetical protein
MANGVRTSSYRLTFEDAVEIWRRFLAGEFQHRIAAAFDVNPGRISEVIKGHKFPGSREFALQS